MTLALGLAVALTFGAADFLGGVATRRNRAFAVVALSQAWGVVVLVVSLALDGIATPSSADLVLGGGAGAVGLVGVTLLYRALASGAMGVVAPVTAVGAAVLPLAWGLAAGERPSLPALAGVAVALTAVAMIARAPASGAGVGGPAEVSAKWSFRHPRHLPLALGAAAGVAFGVFFILLAETSDSAGLSPLMVGRVVSVTLLATTGAITHQRVRLVPGTGATVAGAGMLEMAANVLFVLAARRGLLSLVAVLASLYPAATTLLARIVLRERLAPIQVAGLALALVGLGLIASG